MSTSHTLKTLHDASVQMGEIDEGAADYFYSLYLNSKEHSDLAAAQGEVENLKRELVEVRNVRETLYQTMCGEEREKFNAALMAFAPEEAGHHFLGSATRMVKRAEKAEAELAALREDKARLTQERDDADEYIRAIWRNHQLPSPMGNRLFDRLTGIAAARKEAAP